MKTDGTGRIRCIVIGKSLAKILIFFTFLLIIAGGFVLGDELEEASGDSDDGGQFADGEDGQLIINPQNLRVVEPSSSSSLKLIPRKELRKGDVAGGNRRSSRPGAVVVKEQEESSGDEDGVAATVEDDDDDEDNERENPNLPFPPKNDAFWKEEGDRLKGPKSSNGEIPTSTPKPEKMIDPRPNIILILTDDQDIELGSMEYMPETLKIFREGGVEFRHGYVTTPMCCPSRSSMLTGLYTHNHNIFTNNDNCSSIYWRERYEKKTFGSYLWSEGYYTSYIGKYLNKFDGGHIPHGWSEFNALVMNSKYYNYTVNRNGKKYRYGNKYERDYYPDNIANDTMDFLNRMSPDYQEEPLKATAAKKLPSQPFLLVVSFPSPHGPEDSAPQYSQMFLNVTPHHTPSYNYAPNLDKQWILRTTPRMTPILKDFTNMLMSKRLQTLQSVDLAVKNIFKTLRTSQLLDNTYVFYTSDHGYHVGQFGLVKGKSMPFEFDIRVPFFLRTPKNLVGSGTIITEPVLNIDLAPTFLDLAGVAVPEEMDGHSIVPLLRKYSTTPGFEDTDDEGFKWTDMFLIESSGRRGVGADGGNIPPNKKLNMRISGGKNKSSSSVIGGESDGLIITDNETVELANLCLAHPHPCLPGQKKYCRKEKTRLRFRKCRNNADFQLTEGGIEEMSSDGIPANVTKSERCRCRTKRSTTKSSDEEVDWDSERQKIDAEIEALKLRIESLRERRREMRRRWTSKAYIAKLERNRGNKPKKNNNKVEPVIPPGEILVEEIPTDPTLPINIPQESTAPTLTGETRVNSENNESQKPKTEISMDSIVLAPNPRKANQHSDEDDANLKVDEDEDDTDDDEDDDEEEESENESKNQNNNKRKGHQQPDRAEENKTVKPTRDDEDDSLEVEAEDELLVNVRRPKGKGRKGKQQHNRGRNNPNRNHSNNNNGRNDVRVRGQQESDLDEDENCDCSQDSKWLTQREQEERKRRKLMGKIRKKQKYLNRIDDPRERHEAETCGTEDKMNCFWHDKDHWRTAPFWTSDSFCFCMNSNNNSYSCLRAVNATHNYLYCQFITGFRMYFDLRKDPFQLRNLIGNLRPGDEAWIIAHLQRLKNCKGREECGSQRTPTILKEDSLPPSIWEKVFGRWRRKNKNRNNQNSRRP